MYQESHGEIGWRARAHACALERELWTKGVVECIRSHMGRLAGARARARAQARERVSGRMYQESIGEGGWRARARASASFGARGWPNVSGVTGGGWRARAHVRARLCDA